MKTNKCLTLLLALALAVIPITALADDLAYDDGTYEASTALSLTAAPAVQFVAPGPEVYALDSVSFYLDATVPGTYPVVVQIWDDALDVVDTLSWNVDVAGSAAYTLDLTAAKLPFTGSVRVGIFLRDDALVTAPGDLSLGADLDSPPPFVNSFVYDSAAIPPADPWTPDAASNLGIRASVRLVPAVSCQEFLPPLQPGRTVTMKKGGRTLPLKAFLFDDGAPVSNDLLTAPPLVQLLFSSDTGVEPIDVTAFVAPAGRSNKGQTFRNSRGGKWIYNLKTKKFLPPGTYTVQMISGDGTGYVVEPACTGTFVIEAPKPKKPHPSKGHK
ncbi:MAG: hypothetical protein ACYC9Y_03980 [Candidatus Methylomirabilia bacterium]